MYNVLVFDPGNSTGWIGRTKTGRMIGGTIVEDLETLYEQIGHQSPDVIVYETFQLYPGAAKHLVHNEFYPCQVIGAIKVAALMHRVPYLVGLSPSVKRYSGGLDSRWIEFRQNLDEATTEHTKDAYLLLKYYEMFYEQKPEKLAKMVTPLTM